MNQTHHEKENDAKVDQKAASLLVEAAEKAALLLKEAAEKAATLPIDAAEKAAILPIDAAEKAALLIKDEAEQNANLTAQTKAAIVLREAAEKVVLLPKDAVDKMTFLLNDATKNAVLILKEEAEALARSKIKFLDIAAHELRNPVASISLLLQVAEKQVAINQPLTSDILARLRIPVDRLVRLIVDLLDMSKLERGQLSVEPIKTEMVALISQCVEEFQMQAPKRSFIFNKPEQAIELVVDPLRIYQVLANFLDNAVKYTSEGPIEVAVEALPSRVRVSVADHGEGIPQEKKQSLFTIFSRVNFDSTLHTSGLGLGLAICKGIIDLHKGTIGVESEEGKGSTFYFELPKMDT